MKKEKSKFLEENKNNPEALAKFTRRELLGAGIIPFAARVIAPCSFAAVSHLLFSASAGAETSNPSSAISNSLGAMMTLNLSGGASIHGNVIALNQNQELLPTYDLLGLGKSPSVEYFLGLPFDKKSRMLEGLKSVLSAETISKTKGANLCTTTAADTNAIPPLRSQVDLSAAVEKAGLRGRFFSDLQINASASSIRPFHDNEPKSRLNVSTLQQVINSLSLTAVYANTISSSDTTARFSTGQKKSLASLITKLTGSQLEKQNEEKYAQEGKIIDEASKQLEDIIGGTVKGQDLVDPYNSSHAKSVYNLNTSTPEVTKTIAAITYCNIMGYSSHANITLGGYDYHDPQSRTQANAQDLSAGEQIGRALELANRLQKPLFIFVTTDGSNYSIRSDTNTSLWTGDTTTSMQLIFAYHPNGIHSLSDKAQIGHYLDSQIVEKNTLTGDRTDYVAAAVMINYLSVNNALANFTNIVPATITSARVSEVLRFGLRS